MLIQELLALNEGAAINQADFEQAIDALVTKGKDFATVNMIQTQLNNMLGKVVQGADVAALCTKYLEPVVGKQGYYDLASYTDHNARG